MTTAPSSPDSAPVPQETGRDSERRFTKADLLSFVGWYMSDGTLAPDEQDIADWDAAKVDKRRPRAWSAKYEALERENATLREALAIAESNLVEAAADIESWGAYASPYFQQKHDLAGCVADYVKRAAIARAALAPKNEEGS